ncbi:uncharacterized protein BDW70DRAFT_90946 [Aspergillus foveolatus]|uniref:uncharacterized protein n=1 Tax=Aspergillus foveolatus TaxID=210207 RepID=UPI003CCD257F
MASLVASSGHRTPSVLISIKHIGHVDNVDHVDLVNPVDHVVDHVDHVHRNSGNARIKTSGVARHTKAPSTTRVFTGEKQITESEFDLTGDSETDYFRYDVRFVFVTDSTGTWAAYSALLTIMQHVCLVLAYDTSSRESWDKLVAVCEGMRSRSKGGVLSPYPFLATIIVAWVKVKVEVKMKVKVKVKKAPCLPCHKEKSRRLQPTELFIRRGFAQDWARCLQCGRLTG